jgi:hypothetical protein
MQVRSWCKGIGPISVSKPVSNSKSAERVQSKLPEPEHQHSLYLPPFAVTVFEIQLAIDPSPW